MGRRKHFIPPLLSNSPSDINVASLSARAASRREELVKIDQEELIGGNGPAASSSSRIPRLPTTCVSDAIVPTRVVSQVELVSANVQEVGINTPLPSTISSLCRNHGTNSSSSVVSPKVSQERHMSTKGKSPRMMLSPRLSPRTSPRIFRSPLSPAAINERQGRIADFDLNVPICSAEDQVTLTIGLDYDQQRDGSMSAPRLPNRARTIRKAIPEHVKRSVFQFLLGKSVNGELKGHETREASVAFSVHMRTVQRVWDEGKKCLDQGIEPTFEGKKSNRGRKRKEVDVSKIHELPISKRGTLRDVSTHLNVSVSTAHNMLKQGKIKRISSTLKPMLTDENKKERLKWCLSMLDPRSVPHDPVFKGLFDVVVIDEKWFFISKKTARIYMTPDEPPPARASKNKNFIPKIMFLCALARPRFDCEGNCIFDGKIGCFPFVTYEAAKRTSKNRPAGTVELKPMDSIRTDVNRKFLIEKVLPAIREKWPREDAHKPIYIQQDNAPSHVNPDDKIFCEAAKEGGFDIRIMLQPANSPDLNILDLGFFNSIQSIQYKTT